MAITPASKAIVPYGYHFKEPRPEPLVSRFPSLRDDFFDDDCLPLVPPSGRRGPIPPGYGGGIPLSDFRDTFRDLFRWPNIKAVIITGGVLLGVIAVRFAYVYGPEISKTWNDKKDLVTKFLCDKEDLEKPRKVVRRKISKLNAAVDGVSSQLLAADDAPNGAAVAPDEVEATI